MLTIYSSSKYSDEVFSKTQNFEIVQEIQCQVVKLTIFITSALPTVCGAPQGSVLGQVHLNAESKVDVCMVNQE